jgi:hypothetical protein
VRGKSYPQDVHLWGQGHEYCLPLSNFSSICPFSLSCPHLYTQRLYTFVDIVRTLDSRVNVGDYLVITASPEVET